MIFVVRLAWLGLALIHILPAFGLASSILRQRLYGMDPVGDLGILLAHRALIFTALVAASLIATFVHAIRLPAAFAVTVSVIGFLVAYRLGGTPIGPLRQVALVDCVALPLLAIVWFDIARA